MMVISPVIHSVWMKPTSKWLNLPERVCMKTIRLDVFRLVCWRYCHHLNGSLLGSRPEKKCRTV